MDAKIKERITVEGKSSKFDKLGGYNFFLSAGRAILGNISFLVAVNEIIYLNISVLKQKTKHSECIL